MTRIEELLATPPAERPRKGPRRWEKSADRGCPYRRYWLEDYRAARSEALNHESIGGGWNASGLKGLPTAMICPYRDPFSVYKGRSKSKGHLRAVRRWAAHLKSKRKALP
jgi:hypothetical protein